MKTYNPADIEQKWYAIWEEAGLFSPDRAEAEESYCIVLPPPNVTGILHIGHVLGSTLQDILIRRQRMQGKKVLWLPGTDHAGIATQMVVEKSLRAEGSSKDEIGRAAFIAKTWEWKESYGGVICRQLRLLGCSLDWSRERFTMDEGLSKAVRKAFARFYEQGLIYRGEYLVNWCPVDQTAISDLEVEYKSIEGTLTTIAYPLVDESRDEHADGGYIEIATTRPETLLGDTAIAVHPEDQRYRHLIGREVLVPLVQRRIRIIADEMCDPEFGSGAVKVTPAHDPNDFAMGNRHNLPRINIFTPDAKINGVYPPLEGVDRFEARRRIIELLKEGGWWRSDQKHEHSVGHSQRQKAVVEPRLSEQWFCRMDSMAEQALQATSSGALRIIPANQQKIFDQWMRKIQDWCISRQLWWGHPIPAWHCQDCAEITVSSEDATACCACGSQNIKPDEDVLDTWFSSGLFPFSAMGWPEDTADLQHFYPNSALITGYDIIFFWVARMVMMGSELTGKVPFPEVFTHGVMRDEHGRKVSKSLGNYINPIELFDKYGADATRFALCSLTVMANDLKLSDKTIEESKFFINKLWNAAKFCLFHRERLGEPQPLQQEDCGIFELWLLDQWHQTLESTEQHWQNYRFHEAANGLYTFVWRYFCDWYIELSKPVLFGKLGQQAQAAALSCLLQVFDGILRALHPIIPFVTEELWQQLSNTRDSGSKNSGDYLMVSTPAMSEAILDKDRVQQAEQIIELVSAIRNVYGENDIPLGKKTVCSIQECSPPLHRAIVRHELVIQSLCGTELAENHQVSEQGLSTVITNTAFQAVVDFSQQSNPEQERKRLQKQEVKLQAKITSLQQMLENEAFTRKAPPAVVAKNRNELEALLSKAAQVQKDLQKLN